MSQSTAQLDEVLHVIRFSPKKRKDVFLALSHHEQGRLALRLSKRVLSDLTQHLSDTELVPMLEQLDPDQATDIIQMLPKKRQKKVIEKLSKDLQQSVSVLTQFDPETAAGIMNIDYIQVDADDTIETAAAKFKAHEKRSGRLPAVIVLEKGRVIGYMPGHQFGFAPFQEQVKTYAKSIKVISYDMDHDAVIKLFKQHPHNKVVVVGEEGQAMGIIYSDDILRILEEQESASLYDFAGVHAEETVLDNAGTKIKSRYKWLIINLGTAFLASFTVSAFDEIISKYVLLAVYMPIVAGMGGNAATQTLAVLVRGISLNQIDLKTAWPTLRREIFAAFVNGLINGVIVAAIVLLFNRDVKIALTLGIAMVVNLLVAAFFGTIIPLVMEKLGKDPATSATIFITTATDVLGFLVFLGLATVLL